jgi:hypothetical protein
VLVAVGGSVLGGTVVDVGGGGVPARVEALPRSPARVGIGVGIGASAGVGSGPGMGPGSGVLGAIPRLGPVGAPRRARIAATSSAEPGRSAGALDKSRATKASTSAGASGATVRSPGAGTNWWAPRMPPRPPPSNGSRPLIIWNRMMPSA